MGEHTKGGRSKGPGGGYGKSSGAHTGKGGKHGGGKGGICGVIAVVLLGTAGAAAYGIGEGVAALVRLVA